MGRDEICFAEPEGAASKAATAPTSIAGFPPTVDIGEQVVGSRHMFDVLKMPNVTHGPQMLSAFSIVVGDSSPTPFFSTMPKWEPFNGSKPFQIGFAPGQPGLFAARARFTILWSDGSTTERETHVTGRARNLNDSPIHRPHKDEPQPIHANEPADIDRSELEKATEQAKSDLAYEEKLAQNAAASIARAQITGVTNARTNEATFEQAVPGAPWWTDLAKLAVSMGIAGIAGAIANTLSQRLLNHVNESRPAGEQIANNVSWLRGVTDTVKEGLKSGSKDAAKALAPPAKPKTDNKEGTSSAEPSQEPEGPKTYSSDGRVQFYAQQFAQLGTLESTNQDIITNLSRKLEPHLAATPKTAIAAMRQVRESLQAQRADAILVQQLHTESQWVSGLAQSRLGHGVHGNEAGEHIHHTLMKGARNGRSRDGVLTIKVYRLDTDLDGDPRLQVIAASIDGIAQPIADHLREMKLADLPIPIMLDVSGTMKAQITRDEGGVVRVTGKSDRGDAFPHSGDTEAQNVRAAELLVDAVLKKSLAKWNVPRVTTNDAHKSRP